jgi:hypothetical protein
VKATGVQEEAVAQLRVMEDVGSEPKVVKICCGSVGEKAEAERRREAARRGRIVVWEKAQGGCEERAGVEILRRSCARRHREARGEGGRWRF